MLSEKCKLKQQWHTTTSLLKWPESGTNNTKCWWGFHQCVNSNTLLVGVRNGTAALEDSLVVSHKMKYTLTIQSTNHTPYWLSRDSWNLCPQKKKKKICARMFIAPLFIIAQIWKQPRCLSGDKQVNKQWYIQTMEYYSALKRTELSSNEKTWRNLKFIFPSERSQSEKPTYYMIPSVWHSGEGKTMETIKDE